jgi:hypothetical protein
MRAPPFPCSRLFPRLDPRYRLLAVKGYGQRGFIQFVSPYITSSPAHSVVMSDLAVLHRAEECGCGLTTDWFELLGRASHNKARSCALAASELIKGN